MADVTNKFEQGRFNLHRQALLAADAAAPLVLSKTKGVNAYGYDKAIIDVKRNAGTFTQVIIQILFWSDESGDFVQQYPDLTVTLATPGQAVIDVFGRTFYVRVATLTGAALDINISVAAGQSQESFD